jgi:hypothetical protein
LIKVVQEQTVIFGLIYDIRVQDDLAVRQLILVDQLEPELILDQQANRLVPIEIGVLAVGYQAGEAIIYAIPPQPPISLEVITVCDMTELRAFSARLDYLSLILNAAQLPVDELLVAHLNRVAAAQPDEQRYQFLVSAGRVVARLLHHDVLRLEAIFQRLRR